MHDSVVIEIGSITKQEGLPASNRCRRAAIWLAGGPGGWLLLEVDEPSLAERRSSSGSLAVSRLAAERRFGAIRPGIG